MTRSLGNPTGPAEAVEASELGERLRVALTRLPPQQAQAFCLCCLDDLTHRQAASAMDVTVGAIKVLIHRARARLREVFAAAVVDWDADEVLP